MREIDENIVMGGNLSVGGDTRTSGDCVVGGTLRVLGRVEVADQLSVMKGLYPSEAALRGAWPYPSAGMVALVGPTLPAMLYRVEGRRWVSTGKMAGDIAVEVPGTSEAVAAESEARKLAIADERRLREAAVEAEAKKRQEGDETLASGLSSLSEEVARLGDSIGGVRAQARSEFLDLVASYRNGRTSSGWKRRILILHVGSVAGEDQEMAEVIAMARSAGVDAICHSGGFGSPGGGVTAVAALRNHLEMMERLNPTGSIPVLAVAGTTDMAAGSSNFIDFQNTLAGKWVSRIVRGDDGGRGFHYDLCDPDSGEPVLRVVGLDECDALAGGSGVAASSVVLTQRTVDWLVSVLSEAASSGLPVILLGHYGRGDATGYDITGGALNPGDDVRWSHSPFLLPEIVEAMANRSDLHRTWPPTGDVGGCSPVVVNGDYSGWEQPLHLVGMLFGHNCARWSGDCRSVVTGRNYGFPMLGEEALSSASGPSPYSSLSRSGGSAGEVAFSLIAVDTDSRMVIRIPFGAWRPADDENPQRVGKIEY